MGTLCVNFNLGKMPDVDDGLKSVFETLDIPLDWIPTDGKWKELLKKVLEKLKIDKLIVGKLTKSFTDKAGVTKLIGSFSDTKKLEKLLDDKTDMGDKEKKSFVEKIKEKMKKKDDDGDDNQAIATHTPNKIIALGIAMALLVIGHQKKYI